MYQQNPQTRKSTATLRDEKRVLLFPDQTAVLQAAVLGDDVKTVQRICSRFGRSDCVWKHVKGRTQYDAAISESI